MEEYYTIKVVVEHHKHPQGLPKHNDHQLVEVADFRIKDVDLGTLVERATKHIELIDE